MDSKGQGIKLWTGIKFVLDRVKRWALVNFVISPSV
jgi:hypothetical protein